MASGGAAKKYSGVVITLENVLLPPEKLSSSPSQADGLDKETELDLRIVGCELIQTSGILLRIPQVAMATGQVLFQRFYYAKSLVRYPMETTAMACIALASKIEEAPRKIRDVINVFHHIKQVKNGKSIHPVILDSNYITLKNQVIKAERRLLKELGFCCHVKHPHKIIIMYLRLLEADRNRKLAQSSWNYMNDALRTDVFVRYTHETIACACIWLAARQLKICLPENPPWYHIFKITLRNIEDISIAITKLYTRKKIKFDALEAKVDSIRHKQQEIRLRNKTISTLTTPKDATTAFSPSSRNNTPQKKSDHRRRSSSRRSSSRSVAGRKHKKRKHSSRSISRSRSRDKDSRYHSKKKYSRSPSPHVTPPPRFTKNREKGPLVRSRSRSPRAKNSPHRTYDKYDRYGKYDISSQYEKDRNSKNGREKERKFEKIEFEKLSSKENHKISAKDKYSNKYIDKESSKKGNDKYSLNKYADKEVIREKKKEKKYYTNGVVIKHHHKSKKHSSSEDKSRSREKERR